MGTEHGAIAPGLSPGHHRRGRLGTEEARRHGGVKPQRVDGYQEGRGARGPRRPQGEVEAWPLAVRYSPNVLARIIHEAEFC
jgi:hypothetical protein